MRREDWRVACCPVSPCKARTTISFSNFRYSFSYRFHILLENQEEKKWSSGLSSLKESYQRYTGYASCRWFSSSRDYSYTPWQTTRESPEMQFHILDFSHQFQLFTKSRVCIRSDVCRERIRFHFWQFCLDGNFPGFLTASRARVPWICVGEIPCLVCWLLQAPELHSLECLAFDLAPG